MSARSFSRQVTWDLRLLMRSRVGMAVGLTLVSLCALALWTGHENARSWRQQMVGAQQRNSDYQSELLRLIADGDAWARQPFNARGLVVLPPPPLIALASGRSGLDPKHGSATMLTHAHLLFRDYQIDPPARLAAGDFDLAFFIVYLLPLLIIALCHSVLAQDSEQGTDRLLLTQGASLGSVVASRIVARALLVLLPLIAVALFGAFAGGAPMREGYTVLLAAWLAFAVTYAAFWFALAAWISAFRWGEGRTMMALIAAWIALVLVLPALVGSGSRHLHPMPSRFEQIAAARKAEIQAVQDSEKLIGQYMHDHPDLANVQPADAPQWVRSGFVAARAVDDAVTPVVERFDRALSLQQALVDRWQYATPALIARRGLVRLAGTDEHRQQVFGEQAGEFLRAFREATGRQSMLGETLDAERLRGLPHFTFVEPPARRIVATVALPWAALAGIVIVLAIAARRRLRRAFGH